MAVPSNANVRVCADIVRHNLPDGFGDPRMTNFDRSGSTSFIKSPFLPHVLAVGGAEGHLVFAHEDAAVFGRTWDAESITYRRGYSGGVALLIGATNGRNLEQSRFFERYVSIWKQSANTRFNR